MRKLSVNTFVTLDGVMQAPGGPEEDPTGGFAFGGWSFNYWDDATGLDMKGLDGKDRELVLGRRTYEIFAAHWPYVEGPMADSLNSATKYVASTTLDTLDWANSVLIEGDVVAGVERIKAEDGLELQVHGSSNLLQTLFAGGVVDLLRVWTFPLVVGRGKRLFGDGVKPAGLKLADSKTSSTGVVIATYEQAGDIETGSFALEEPTEAEIKRRERMES